jgi:hypothetical protein
MRLRRDVSHLVRTDSVCGIQTDGIVGAAFIQVSPGTDAAPAVAAGDTIAGNDPIELADLIQEGRETFRIVSREFVELTNDASATIGVLKETTQTMDTLLADANQEMKAIAAVSTRAIDEVRGTLADARVIVGEVRNGRGTIGRLLTDDALYQRITNTAAEAERTMTNLQATTERVRVTVDSMTARDGGAQQILVNLRDTAIDTREIVADLAESTEALKRNFFLRGFFRDRGFFDIDALSRDAYVSGALEGNDRTALRVWVDAAGLFARAPDGSEQLTADGRRRLDSAMSDLARYPRDSALVIEGYAEVTDGGAAYVVSSERAAIVRDYLLTRFRRQASLTGVMPMGAVAVGSPRGNERWAGVALTMFVEKSALPR